ncbi:hypothetical protein F503_08223 [Ophiostoma piceae UAMH 11346]|uniref:25S rRNA (Uridine(2843)-N(3))-methyltransferase n=1 Tax=Ophiostoma piceae (strain UAMH 11346) TaxID=1262450 RepID=S3BYV6_OPHP1|nr:hypothetical protein F503_08223 [Ophiostoma piceae UAMH 11346]
MGKLKGTTGGGGPKAAKAQAAAHKQKVQKAAIMAKLAAPEAPEEPDVVQVTELSNPLRQTLLNVYSDTLATTLASSDLHDALQILKKALFERDFSAAFGGDADKATESTGNIAPLDAYAARWSPTRALCYGSVLVSAVVQEHWNPGSKTAKVGADKGDEDADEKANEDADKNANKDVKDDAKEDASKDASKDTVDDASDDESPVDDSPLRMVAIGGGAAEVVAFAALLASGMPCEHRTGDLVLVDSGPWASVVGRLQTTMTTPVAVSTLDGEEERVLVSPAERLAVDVRQLDILKVGDEDMAKLIAGDGSTTTLVTLFFTLNELFTAGGLGAAATFLLRLTNAAPSGTVLLVVDSPGSYAETAVGSQAKRYPMKWLLDRFLTKDDGAWSKVYEDDSSWFRLTSALTYPIRLEDMRYQTHLYVKL